jgi:hypothetical protein
VLVDGGEELRLDGRSRIADDGAQVGCGLDPVRVS